MKTQDTKLNHGSRKRKRVYENEKVGKQITDFFPGSKKQKKNQKKEENTSNVFCKKPCETFFEKDAPHSLAKRRLLFSILKSVAAIRCKQVPKLNRFVLTYVDAFAGKGYFGKRILPKPSDDICQWGTPLIALNAFMQEIDAQLKKQVSIEYKEEATLKNKHIYNDTLEEVLCFRFIFNDIENITELKEFITEYLKTKADWKLICTDDMFIYLSKQSNDQFARTIEIEFSSLKFEKMEHKLESIEGSAFFFLDPFGIKLPLKIVKKLIREGRDIIINLNVQYAARAIKNRKMVKLWKEVFGSKLKKESISNETSKKFCEIANYYCKLLKGKNKPTRLFTTKFVLRKGKLRPDNAELFNLVIATTSLLVLQKIKFSIQRHNQTKGECSFSDYFSINGISIPEGRKTDDSYEANVIYKMFSNKGSVTLGKLKKLIIEKTPFPYHTKALRKLEKDDSIAVTPLDYLDGKVLREKKSLCNEVSHNIYDTGLKYGNFWIIKFKPRYNWKSLKYEATKPN
ncbi:uncharacterized protein LOC136076833 [Hydra vulgaris]|uniref:Uncharacterized protein LOC136076833 n=1 Tax=Hydra vulgaris TaxID=6087 RepID=A0ABM4BC06_HYDVU